MREIKFRAWLKNRKVMGKVLEIHFDKKTTVYAIEDGLGKTWFEKENENAVIMQHTGLKDKNGKEIYERDVLIRENDLENTCVVKWDNESCGFTLNYIYFDESYDMSEFWDDFEVIGNIYENSELLDGDDE